MNYQKKRNTYKTTEVVKEKFTSFKFDIPTQEQIEIFTNNLIEQWKTFEPHETIGEFPKYILNLKPKLLSNKQFKKKH